MNGVHKIDAVLLEVLWNRLISIVNEQAAALMHASFTTVVREAGDLSAGVFNRGGDMIAQAVTGTPGSLATSGDPEITNFLGTDGAVLARQVSAETAT